MTAQSKTVVKSYFQRGLRPTQAQYTNLVDSYQNQFDVLDSIGSASLGGATGIVGVISQSSAVYYPPGSVGLAVLMSDTATSAKQELNIGAAVSADFATTAQAIAGLASQISMDPVLTRNEIETFAFTSAKFATTAQATSGLSDGTIMSPVLTKNAILSQTVFTSASFATTAQATTGTNDGTLMNPVLTKNAIASLAGTGALILLSAQTASTSAAIDFTSLITSTYDDYVIIFDGVIPVTGGASLYFRTSSNNGSSYDAGANNYAWGQSGTLGSGAGATEIDLGIGGAPSNNAAVGIAGTLRIYNLNSTTVYKRAAWDISYGSNTGSGNFVSYAGAGARISTAAVNAVRFLMQSGNISTGTFKLYGVKKT